MSHFTTIKTQIKDIEAVRLACQEMGLSLLQNAEARGYYENRTKGDYIIRLRGPYDIALNKQPDGSFGLTADLWNGHVEQEVGQGYGRLLQLYGVHDLANSSLNGGKAGGKQVVPETWVDEATHPRPDTPQVNHGNLAPSGEPIGYGYCWWLYPAQPSSSNGEEAFEAVGIFGQRLFINRKEKLVGVFWCVWPESWDNDKALEIEHFLDAAIRASR